MLRVDLKKKNINIFTSCYKQTKHPRPRPVFRKCPEMWKGASVKGRRRAEGGGRSRMPGTPFPGEREADEGREKNRGRQGKRGRWGERRERERGKEGRRKE